MAEERSITVIIKGNEQGLTAAVDRSRGSLTQLERSVAQTTQRSAQNFQQFNSRMLSTQRTFGPMSIAVTQLSGHMGHMDNSLGLATRGLGVFGVNALASAASAGTLRGGIIALGATLGPVTLAVVAIGTALSFLIGRSREARAAQERYNKAVKDADVSALRKHLEDVTAEYDKQIEKVNRLREAQELWRQRASQAVQVVVNAFVPAAAQAQVRDQVDNIVSEGVLARARQFAQNLLPPWLLTDAATLRDTIHDLIPDWLIERARRLWGFLSGAADPAAAAEKIKQAQEALAEAERTKIIEPLQTRIRHEIALAQATERQIPFLKARAELDKLIADGLSKANQEAARAALFSRAQTELQGIDRKAREQLLETLKKQNDQFALQIHTMTEGEGATEQWTVATLKAQRAQLELNAAQSGMTETVKRQLAAIDQEISRREILVDGIQRLNQERIREQLLADIVRATTLEAVAAMEGEIGVLERRSQLRQTAEQHEITLLQARGAKDTEVMARRLQMIEAEIDALERLASQSSITRDQLSRMQELSREAEVIQAQLERAGEVTVNIGDHVANTLNTMFNGLIQGTLRGLDVVRAGIGLLGNVVTDIFRQTIQKKLAFEVTLFKNVRGLGGQMQSAFAAGAVPAGGGGGGGGTLGFFSNILGGGGVGGGGGAATGILGLLGTGVGRAGIGGFIGSFVGGGSTGSMIGGTLGGLAFPALANAGLSAALGTAAAFGGGTLAGAVFGSLIMPGIGAIVGALLGSLVGGLFKKKPRRIMFGLQGGTTVEDFLAGEGLNFRARTVTQSQAESIANTLGEATQPFAENLGRLRGSERQRVLDFELPQMNFSTRNRRHVQALADQFAREMQAALLAAFSQGLQLEFASQEHLFAFLEVRDPVRRNIDELRLQLDMLGKTREEAMALQRAFDLAEISLAGFTAAQVAHIESMMRERDALALQLERRRAIEQTTEQIKLQTDEMELQLAMLGRTLEEQQAIRREFELRKLAEQGIFGDMSPQQLRQLEQLGDLTTKGIGGAAALVGGGPAADVLRDMEERDRVARALAAEQQFTNLADQLRRQIEDARFELFARDLTPEEQDFARIEHDLGRLVGLGSDQINELRELKRTLLDLTRELQGGKHIDIHLSPDHDAQDIARELAKLLSGRTAPIV